MIIDNPKNRDDADYKIAAYKAAIDKQPVSIGTFDVTNPSRIVYNID